MSIVIITESARLASLIAKSIKVTEPAYILYNAFSVLKFEYPNICTWNQYPLTHDIKFKDLPWNEFLALEVLPEGKINQIHLNKEVFSNKTLTIINMCDPDNRGSFIFDTFVNNYFQEFSIAAVYYDYTGSPVEQDLNASTYKNLVGQLRTNKNDYMSRVNMAKIKYYLDYNWNINSFAILGKTLKIAGIKTSVHLSKYAFQLFLYLLTNNKQSWTDTELATRMADWIGTAKYTSEGLTSLGSPSSYSPIMQSLKDLGLLAYNIDKTYTISELGKLLSTFIHKDCKDSDLPFRIENWQKLSFKEAKPLIDRYIKTFFGKQKRFLNTK